MAVCSTVAIDSLLANREGRLYSAALSRSLEKPMARPKGMPWRLDNVASNRDFSGAQQGDENAQAEDQERRQETLQAHGDRQDQAWGRWKAPPADQPQRQIYPSEPWHRHSRRRRHGAREGLGPVRPEVRRPAHGTRQTGCYHPLQAQEDPGA